MTHALTARYSCFVFDLDGTLLDTRAGMIEAINAVLTRRDFTAVTAEQLASALHFGLDAMLARAMELSGGVATRDLEVETRQYYLDSAPQSVRLFPDAYELLSALHKAGGWLAVCTNQLQSSARELLKSFALEDFFSEVIGGDSLAERKPDPLPLRWLMARAAVPPSSMLMIGDSEVDRACAVAACVDVVLMSHGYGLHDLQQPCELRADFLELSAELLPRQLAPR